MISTEVFETALTYSMALFFLEYKVVIGDGVDHGFAWWTSISSVGAVDDDWWGLVVDWEGGPHLNYESI